MSMCGINGEAIGRSLAVFWLKLRTWALFDWCHKKVMELGHRTEKAQREPR